MQRTLPLLLAIACHLPALAAEPPAPAVVRSQAQFEAVLASGQVTPLDVLTPYGKRRMVRSISWVGNGMGGFSGVPLMRELDAGQLDHVLRFLDLSDYRAMLAAGMTGAALRLPAPSADVVQRLEKLEDFSRDIARQHEDGASTTVGRPEVLRRYQDSFAGRMDAGALRRQPLGDLLPLFDAAALASFDNPGSAALDQLLLVHAELHARGVDTRRTLDASVLDALLRARRFAQARAFAAARPHLDAGRIPEVVDELATTFRGRSVYRYDAARNTLTRQAMPAPVGTELVMVVSESCHFSEAALEAIGSDAALQDRLQAAGLLLLTPPNEAPRLRFVAAWNAAHPALPMRIPFDAGEWRAIDVTGVPAFYLLRNGKVIAHHSGWDGAAGRTALLALLDTADRERP